MKTPKPFSAQHGFVKGTLGKLSYRISGRGPKILLCFNGVGVAKWVWEPLERYFAPRYKIITWDYHGHGLSKGPKEANKASFMSLVEDSIILIDHLRIKKAHLIGHSAGFQVALEVLRRKPALAEGLISCLGTPGKTLETFMESFVGQLVFDIGYILNAVLPETSHLINTNLLNNPLTYQIGAALKLVNPAISGRKDIKKYLDHLAEMDFALFNHIIASGAKISSEDVLPAIKVPTLVIASQHDKFVPIGIANKMHEKIRKSELFIIRNGTHAALLEQPDIFNLAIDRFLEG